METQDQVAILLVEVTEEAMWDVVEVFFCFIFLNKFFLLFKDLVEVVDALLLITSSVKLLRTFNVALCLVSSVAQSTSNNADLFQDNSVAMFPVRSVKMFLASNVQMFLNSNVKVFLVRNVLMFQGSSVGNSAAP